MYFFSFQDTVLCDNVISLLKVGATNSTEEHKIEGCYGCEDKHYFLDVDMAILGMGPADYEKYTNHVREEYAFLDEETYKELRIKVNYRYILILCRNEHGRLQERAKESIATLQILTAYVLISILLYLILDYNL